MATATESKDIQIVLERDVMRRANQAKVVARRENPKMLEHLCGPSPISSSMASSTPQTETSTTVGTVDATECAALDLCATAKKKQEIVNPRWMAFNVDTGAGGTVWPMNADHSCNG